MCMCVCVCGCISFGSTENIIIPILVILRKSDKLVEFYFPKISIYIQLLQRIQPQKGNQNSAPFQMDHYSPGLS